jgi:hypothetical protein
MRNFAPALATLKSWRPRARTGVEYQVELTVLWDHKPNAAIRILGSIDDGGLRAFFPLSDSRLVMPKASPNSA